MMLSVPTSLLCKRAVLHPRAARSFHASLALKLAQGEKVLCERSDNNVAWLMLHQMTLKSESNSHALLFSHALFVS